LSPYACVILDISILLVSLVLTISYKMAMIKYILSNTKIYYIFWESTIFILYTYLVMVTENNLEIILPLYLQP